MPINPAYSVIDPTNPLATLWTGRCTIYQYQDVTDPESKQTTQREVAVKLGISQSYISRLEKKIVNQIKKEMIKMAN